MGGHETRTVAHQGTDTIDVEQSWAHIQHALHGEAHSPHALAESAAAARHEAAEHIVVATREGSLWKAIAIGAFLVLALVGAAAWMDHLGFDAKAASAVTAADARVVTANAGQLGNLLLDDGTKVHLAPESKLSIAKAFGTTMRAVGIEGAANFEVAAGQPHPFVVHAGDAIIEAKGTRFTVRDYPADSAVTVVMDEGTVEVRRAGAKQTLTAGQSLQIAGGAMRTASGDERDAADGWRRGFLTVTSRPLHEVLPQLHRWYGLDVHAEPAVSQRPVTFRARWTPRARQSAASSGAPDWSSGTWGRTWCSVNRRMERRRERQRVRRNDRAPV
jgi:Fe2+-dicitrate sensor, membrane component